MVKLLLSKGASPDAPEDELPPVFYALSTKRDDIAQALIEGGTNLHQSYIAGDHRLTVGDMAILAKKPVLTELIRQRGGSFTKNIKDIP
jgi:ankyrin repeat protein